MEFLSIVNWIGLGLAAVLAASSLALVRPANGERPILVGMMASSIFGLYIAVIRIASLQAHTRETFGVILAVWLAFKLWSL